MTQVWHKYGTSMARIQHEFVTCVTSMSYVFTHRQANNAAENKERNWRIIFNPGVLGIGQNLRYKRRQPKYAPIPG